MSVYIELWVTCDKCNMNQVCDGKTFAAARKNAREIYGWKHVKRDGKLVDLCPKCILK